MGRDKIRDEKRDKTDKTRDQSRQSTAERQRSDENAYTKNPAFINKLCIFFYFL